VGILGCGSDGAGFDYVYEEAEGDGVEVHAGGGG
jgi:hypothetical protein